MARTTEMAWERKKIDAEGSGARVQWPVHHLLVPNQYKRSEPEVKGLKGCGLVVRGKVVYFGVPVKASFGENSLLGWHFAQKRQAKGLDHLMHAIEVDKERASNPYPFE